MAQQVTDVSYFPFSVHFHSDPKIGIVEVKFGLRSIGIITKLLCNIYSTSFYCHWDADVCGMFTRQLGGEVDEKYVQDVIDALLERGFFHKEKYEKYSILTSAGIQERYFTITARRRKHPRLPEEYILIDLSAYKNVVEVGLKHDPCNANAGSTPKRVYNFQQRKGKKNKVKRSKETLSLTRESMRECVSEDETPESFHEFCKEWREELLADKDWCGSVCRQSGLGKKFLPLIPDKINEFEDYIISCGEQQSIGCGQDYSRRFHFWWQKHGFKQDFSNQAFLKVGRPAVPPVNYVQPSRIEQLRMIGEEATEIARQLLQTG